MGPDVEKYGEPEPKPEPKPECPFCFDKKLRIDSLELRNRYLKRKVDTLESITFFSWVSWFIFGERWEHIKSVDQYEPDK